ncbi:MAG: hypothetical protein ACI9U2_004549 [Bradymonadia bacterium]|jgi:hypothetical protein
MQPDASILLTGGFVVLPWIMLVGLVWATRRGVGEATAPGDPRRIAVIGFLGLAVAAGLALTGITARLDTTPPLALPVFAVFLLGTVALGLSPLGRRLASLPIRLVIGFQAFRVLVELLLHQGMLEGVVPPQLSWSGRNLDVFAGLLAVPVGLYADRLPKAVLWAFNLIGLGLLLNVIIVAVLSVPTPLQQFEPANTFVAFFPFIWLPTGLVTIALLGHVLLTRRLLRRS